MGAGVLAGVAAVAMVGWASALAWFPSWTGMPKEVVRHSFDSRFAELTYRGHAEKRLAGPGLRYPATGGLVIEAASGARLQAVVQSSRVDNAEILRFGSGSGVYGVDGELLWVLDDGRHHALLLALSRKPTWGWVSDDGRLVLVATTGIVSMGKGLRPGFDVSIAGATPGTQFDADGPGLGALGVHDWIEGDALALDVEPRRRLVRLTSGDDGPWLDVERPEYLGSGQMSLVAVRLASRTLAGWGALTLLLVVVWFRSPRHLGALVAIQLGGCVCWARLVCP